MKRVRLTTRLANRIFVANTYQNLENMLLREYDGLRNDAKRYRDKELQGFELHHLQETDDKLVPSTHSKCRDRKIRNKEEQSRYVMEVIRYSKQENDKVKQEFLNNSGLNDIDLVNDKAKLDDEIDNSAYIPSEFHHHLHITGKHADSRDELYKLYKEYMEKQSLNKLLRESLKAKGSPYEEIIAIRKMVNFVLEKYGKQTALYYVNLSYEQLIIFLTQKGMK